MTGTQPKPNGLGSKPLLIAIAALALAAAIGVAVFIVWRKVSASAIESKVLSSDINKAKTEMVQVNSRIEKRDEKISDHSDRISTMEKEIYMLQTELKEVKRQLDKKPSASTTDVEEV